MVDVQDQAERREREDAVGRVGPELREELRQGGDREVLVVLLQIRDSVYSMIIKSTITISINSITIISLYIYIYIDIYIYIYNLAFLGGSGGGGGGAAFTVFCSY